MIFRNIQDIKYPFLKDAATKLSRKLPSITSIWILEEELVLLLMVN